MQGSAKTQLPQKTHLLTYFLSFSLLYPPLFLSLLKNLYICESSKNILSRTPYVPPIKLLQHYHFMFKCASSVDPGQEASGEDYTQGIQTSSEESQLENGTIEFAFQHESPWSCIRWIKRGKTDFGNAGREGGAKKRVETEHAFMGGISWGQAIADTGVGAGEGFLQSGKV